MAKAGVPPPRVQRTTKPSKNTVQTGVFVGHAIQCLINSVPKPGTQCIRPQTITVQTEVFIGQGIRWARGGGGYDGGRREQKEEKKIWRHRLLITHCAHQILRLLFASRSCSRLKLHESFSSQLSVPTIVPVDFGDRFTRMLRAAICGCIKNRTRRCTEEECKSRHQQSAPTVLRGPVF